MAKDETQKEVTLQEDAKKTEEVTQEKNTDKKTNGLPDEVVSVMASMQQEIERLRNMVGEVGDRARVERFMAREQQERERAGVIDRTCFIQMYNGKFVLEWGSMAAANNRVFVDRDGKLKEELTIPFVRLVDPVTGEETKEENLDYRMFHQTRSHTPARVVEIIEEKRGIDGKVEQPKSYKVTVEGYERPITVAETFVN